MSQQFTAIDVLQTANDDWEILADETIDMDNLSRTIVDLSLTLPTRMKALDLYCQKYGHDNTVETINKLAMMYEMSGTKMLREFLYNICVESNLSGFLRSLAARALWSHNNKDDLAYKAIDVVYGKMDASISTPYRIDFIKMMMINDEYKDKARDHFCNTINDQAIECEYRYRAILSLEHSNNEDEKIDLEAKKKMNWFIAQACQNFVLESRNKITYRILAGQYILQNCRDMVDVNAVEQILLSFAQDEKVEYNCRADATDVLLQLGSEQVKIIAQQIIMTLGTAGQECKRTIYDNAQNVHTKEVEDSVRDALEFLHTFELAKMPDGLPITFEYVQGKILDLLPKSKKKGRRSKAKNEREEKIRVALARINYDRALYSKYNCTLGNILLRIWTYLTSHLNEDAIKDRLLEELVEMAGTCSSGYATRLINSISGFGDFSIRISWRDQIAGNLAGRLNARIRDMDDLTLQEKVLNEMTLESARYEDRKNFLKFFRRSLPAIQAEMYQEFKQHLSDTDFDLYLRSAILTYETGQAEKSV